MIQPVGAVTFDWQGFSRVEFYHSQTPKDKFNYGNFHTVLKPRIQVVDGLSVYGRLDLFPLKHMLTETEAFTKLEGSFAERQTGLVFVQNSKMLSLKKEDTLLMLSLSQFYFTYETDFFKFQLGKAPYHFGLGVTHSAETDAFDHWITHLDQVSAYFEYFQFYVQPLVYRWGSKLYASVQGGMTQENWGVEAFYRYDVDTSETFAEVFGRYNHPLFDGRLSVSYFFEEALKLGVAFEGAAFLPHPFPQLEIKAGYASEGFYFHPNYDVALLLWNRQTHVSSAHPKDKQDELKSLLVSFLDMGEEIVAGRVNGVAYFSPRVSFSFVDDSVQVQPVVSVGYDLTDNDLYYEADLNLKYSLENNFSVSLQGGALYGDGEIFYGVLSQATVTF